MIITKEFAKAFAIEWVEAWNAQDLNRILSHYTNDITVHSPLAAKRFPDSNGVLHGKEAIRSYWRIGLTSQPNLKFTLVDIFIGVDSISILYTSSARDHQVVEVMFFDQDKRVSRTYVYY